MVFFPITSFRTGGKTLVTFIPGEYVPAHERVPNEYYFVFIGLIAILLVETIVYIYMRKRKS